MFRLRDVAVRFSEIAPDHYLPLWTEAMAIFARHQESFDHFGVNEVAVELIQLTQPEIVARMVRVGSVVWIASQIAKVLHQHKSAIFLCLIQVCIFRHRSQHLRPRLHAVREVAHQLIPLSGR